MAALCLVWILCGPCEFQMKHFIYHFITWMSGIQIWKAYKKYLCVVISVCVDNSTTHKKYLQKMLFLQYSHFNTTLFNAFTSRFNHVQCKVASSITRLKLFPMYLKGYLRARFNAVIDIPLDVNRWFES